MKKRAFTREIPEKGLSKRTILNYLKKTTQMDMSFEADDLLGSMCTHPPKLATQVFSQYNEVNLGDPGLFPGSFQIEQQAIAILGQLLHSSNANGVFTTGGTEANIIAVRTALLHFLKNHPNKSDRRELKLVVPASAHFSFDKAAQLMGVQLIKIPLTSDFTMDVEATKKALDENCFCLVAVAGTTGLGVIDPIDEIGALALQHSIYFHVDAAFGGFVIPFMESDFQKQHPFDFQIPGVQSITIDPHKMGRGITPGGAIIFRNDQLCSQSITEVRYLAGGFTKHLTVVGTRSGAAVLASFASLLHEGRLGYEKGVKKALEVTHLLEEKIRLVEGYQLKRKAQINVVGICPLFISAVELGQKLRERKVAVSVFEDYIRIVMMPHVTPKKIDHLIEALKEIYRASQPSN